MDSEMVGVLKTDDSISIYVELYEASLCGGGGNDGRASWENVPG